MGEFIAVYLKDKECAEHEGCRRLISLCPVDIFVEGEGGAVVEEKQVDECTLCGLCWEALPDAVEVRRLYIDDAEARA